MSPPIAPVCYCRAGARKGAFLTGDIHGFVDGHLIRFRSSHKYEGSYVNYDFSGAFENGRLRGQVEDMSTIDPGEFGEATWSAERYQYTEPRGVRRRRTEEGSYFTNDRPA